MSHQPAKKLSAKADDSALMELKNSKRSFNPGFKMFNSMKKTLARKKSSNVPETPTIYTSKKLTPASRPNGRNFSMRNSQARGNNQMGNDILQAKKIYEASLGNTSAGAMKRRPPSMGRPQSAMRSTRLGLTRSVTGTGVPPQDLGNNRASSVFDASMLSSARGRRHSVLSVPSAFSSPVNRGSGVFKAISAGEPIIRHGVFLKKSVTKDEWQKRMFLLTEKSIYYYDEVFPVPTDLGRVKKTPKGQIPLEVIDDVTKESLGEDSILVIRTPSRSYRLKLSENDGIDAWVASISGAHENVNQQLPTSNGRKRESFSHIKADELDFVPQGVLRDPALAVRRGTMFGLKTGKDHNLGHAPASIQDIEKWSPVEVAAWFSRIDLDEYGRLFFENGVTGEQLKGMSTLESVTNVGVPEEQASEILQEIESLIASSMPIE